MILKIAFLLMIIMALASVQAKNLKTAVIYLGLYSIICSFSYLLLSAPDVALAEAIIGSTLATIIFLVALQKYKVFNICYLNKEFSTLHDRQLITKKSNLIHLVEEYCESKDLDPYITFSADELDETINSFRYDLIIYQEDKKVYFYGRRRNYHITNIHKHIQSRKKFIDREQLDFNMILN